MIEARTESEIWKTRFRLGPNNTRVRIEAEINASRIKRLPDRYNR